MTETLTRSLLDRNALDRLFKDEPAWLTELRRDAFARYERLPQPDDRTPGWRRLSLDGIDLHPLAAAHTHFEFSASDTDLYNGLVVSSLDRALGSDQADALRSILAAPHVGKSVGRYAPLGEAFWQGGVFVFAPAGFTASEAISIAISAGTYPRVVIVAGAGAKLSVAETHRENDALSSGVVDIICGEGSSVSYLHVQDCARTSSVFSHQRALVNKDAHLLTLNFGIGARLARTDVEVELQGQGAQSDMLGLVFAEENQEFDYHTLQGHRAPNTRSDLLFKSALDDSSHSAYTGVIIIDRGAQRSDAYQANRNLLLNEGARADTEPMLEIEADDVRCTHGATVGPVDDEQLFYTQTRGLEPDTAARLIVEGFFHEVFEKFDEPGLTETLRAKVAPHLDRVGAH